MRKCVKELIIVFYEACAERDIEDCAIYCYGDLDDLCFPEFRIYDDSKSTYMLSMHYSYNQDSGLYDKYSEYVFIVTGIDDDETTIYQEDMEDVLYILKQLNQIVHKYSDVSIDT